MFHPEYFSDLRSAAERTHERKKLFSKPHLTVGIPLGTQLVELEPSSQEGK